MLPLNVDLPFHEIGLAREIAAARVEEAGLWGVTASQASALTVHDHTITSPSGTCIATRVYKPNNVHAPHGALVFFHGGGFALGSLESEHNRCIQLSHGADCVVLSVDYRLAPENPFPAGLDDCYDALSWVAEHALDLGVDPTRISVGGVSAGGALAAAVALRARDTGGPRIAFQLLIYPVLDERMTSHSMRKFVDTPVWTYGRNRKMWDYYGHNERYPRWYASPALAPSLASLPSAAVLVAGIDPLRDEAVSYACELMRADVAVELHLYPGAFHGFDVAVPTAQISQRALAEQVECLRGALRA